MKCIHSENLGLRVSWLLGSPFPGHVITWWMAIACSNCCNTIMTRTMLT